MFTRTALASTFAALSIAGAASARTIDEIAGFEPHFVLPPGTVMKSIQADFGAVGDGKTDDTAAFQKAFADPVRSIYIPHGTYLVRDQLRFAGTGKKKRVMLIGESRSKSIIKLADKSPGFDDPAKPKSVIYALQKGMQGEQNMANFFQHLTIEVGSGNPGAIGLQYHSNNTGAVKDVTIRASDPAKGRGAVGLACVDWDVGPADARYVTVDGFATGIKLTKIGNYFPMEHVTIRNCDVGLETHSDSIRDLVIENCPAPIKGNGLLVLIDTTIKGKGAVAIDNPKGGVLVRNLKTTGYAMSVSAKGGTSDKPTIESLASGNVVHNWAPGTPTPETLNLPVEESPELQYPQSEKEWVVLPAKGDITAELQKAIDGGVRTIYLQGSPTISSTIHVRGKVERIMSIGVPAFSYKTGTAPVFSIEDGGAPAVTLELIYGGYGNKSGVEFEQATKRTFVLRHGNGSYRTMPAGHGGKVFVESHVGGFYQFTKVSAWVRDINTELGGPDIATIVNDGGTLWILGQKTEDFATKLKMVNGSSTELLGGVYRQNWGKTAFDSVKMDTENPPPLFILENSRASLTWFTWGNGIAYKTLVRETRDGVTKDLDRKTNNAGTAILFTGFADRSPSK